MEELRELKERMKEERPAPWAALPDLALYMDQLISYMPRQLIRFEESENLTSAMVNNYIKDGLLPRAEGKRYGPTHLAYLTAICALKQVLSVKEMKTLIRNGAEGRDPERLYSYFCQELDRALNETADGLEAETEQEDLARLALGLALRSYANKLACERILSLLQVQEEAVDEKKQSKNKSKSD
ncbi:MAG: DUF1836 domain-containing protein [Oscillospiraceae bacterium]